MGQFVCFPITGTKHIWNEKIENNIMRANKMGDLVEFGFVNKILLLGHPFIYKKNIPLYNRNEQKKKNPHFYFCDG